MPNYTGQGCLPAPISQAKQAPPSTLSLPLPALPFLLPYLLVDLGLDVVPEPAVRRNALRLAPLVLRFTTSSSPSPPPPSPSLPSPSPAHRSWT